MVMAHRHLEQKLTKFEPPPPSPRTIAAEGWWKNDWRELPARRNEFDDAERWPLNVQVAGSLVPLQQHLETQGWRRQPQAGWKEALHLLDVNSQPNTVPVLPATLDTRVEALLMVRNSPHADECYVLRLWPTATQLQPEQQPLWLGSVQTLHYDRHFSLMGLWYPLRGVDLALKELQSSLSALHHREEHHPDTNTPILLIDNRAPTVPTGAPTIPQEPNGLPTR